MSTRRLRLNPRSWVYLFVHVFIFLVGIILARSSGLLLQGIGASLIATGLAGWVAFLYVLVSDRAAQRLDILTRFGFIDAFPARAVRIREEYDTRLKDARHNIDVLGFALSSLREDYAQEFSAWAQRAKVRVLLIDPQYPSERTSFAQQRDREENNQPGSMQADVYAFVKSVRNLLSARHGRFQVRLYRALPSVNVFRIDDYLFWGPYLVRDQSRNSPTFLVRRGGILYERLLGHFDTIWDDPELSREVPQAWLQA